MDPMETLLPALSGLLQLGALALVAADVLLYQRLVGAYATARLTLGADASALPSVTDLRALDGLQGVSGPLRYRWDRDRRALIFGRGFGVVGGERGHAVGAVRFAQDGTPVVRWRPAPMTPVPVFFALGCLGLAYFVVVEETWQAALGVPILGLLCGLIGVVQTWNARGTLDRLLLPRLGDILRERLAP